MLKYLCNIHTYPLFVNTDVTIQMMEIEEQVMEGGMVTVCASLTGQLGRNVAVRLATSSGGTGERNTLIGANVIYISCSLIFIPASDTDFVSASDTRIFTATDTTDKCITIRTSEDNIFEANEMFTVSLSVISPTTGPTGVTVIEGRSQTTVIILDDDGI